MINSARILNCESHKDTYVEFDSGVNVFVGDTDAGKSSLLRSLRYAIWNERSSKSLVSHWGGPLQVQLKMDDYAITRKSDTKEIYLLNDLEFHSFGIKVPEEISKVINMEEINSQAQIDNFFLLTETPGYVATFLNKIANLEQIDSTTKAIKSELNETKRLIEHQKDDLKKKETELETFSFLSKFKQDLNEADALQLKVVDCTMQIDILSYHIKEIKKCNDLIEENKGMLNLREDVNEALSLTKDLEVLEAKIKKITWQIKYISDIDKEIEELTKLLDLKLLVAETFELKKELSNKEAKLDTLNSLSSKISTIDTKIEITQVEITTDKDIYETELHKLGKCFFCGSKIK